MAIFLERLSLYPIFRMNYAYFGGNIGHLFIYILCVSGHVVEDAV